VRGIVDSSLRLSRTRKDLYRASLDFIHRDCARDSRLLSSVGHDAFVAADDMTFASSRTC
jgi:hypothetical protein